MNSSGIFIREGLFEVKSKSYLLTLSSLMLALVTSGLDVHANIKSFIYGLSALGLILGAYLAFKRAY